MRRKQKNLKNKGGHTENGAPRQLIDEVMHRELAYHSAFPVGPPGNLSLWWDARYSGFANRSRPLDYPISLRPFVVRG